MEKNLSSEDNLVYPELRPPFYGSPLISLHVNEIHFFVLTPFIFFTSAYDTDVFYAHIKNLKEFLFCKSSMLPYLTFCHLTWHCKSSDATKVERVQKQALTINRADLPSLQNRCLQDFAILMCKVKHCMVPSNVSDIFSVTSSKGHPRIT